MAVSPRMLALIQKIEAADAAHFARLRKSAKQDKEAKSLAKTQAAVRFAGDARTSLSIRAMFSRW